MHRCGTGSPGVGRNAARISVVGIPLLACTSIHKWDLRSSFGNPACSPHGRQAPHKLFCTSRSSHHLRKVSQDRSLHTVELRRSEHTSPRSRVDRSSDILEVRRLVHKPPDMLYQGISTGTRGCKTLLRSSPLTSLSKCPSPPPRWTQTMARDVRSSIDCILQCKPELPQWSTSLS